MNEKIQLKILKRGKNLALSKDMFVKGKSGVKVDPRYLGMKLKSRGG